MRFSARPVVFRAVSLYTQAGLLEVGTFSCPPVATPDMLAGNKTKDGALQMAKDALKM